MPTRPDNCTTESESVATITVEDVDKFDYDRAFDWLEDNDVDPGNLQSLPELREFIKSYLTKYESREILSKVRKEEVGLLANVTDSVTTITVEDVNKFDYDKAFDWLEENDVDPGNLQSLPELIKLIKSHITKAKSREDLSEAGKDVVVAPAGVTGGVSVIEKDHYVFWLCVFFCHAGTPFYQKINFHFSTHIVTSKADV